MTPLSTFHFVVLFSIVTAIPMLSRFEYHVLLQCLEGSLTHKGLLLLTQGLLRTAYVMTQLYGRYRGGVFLLAPASWCRFS